MGTLTLEKLTLVERRLGIQSSVLDSEDLLFYVEKRIQRIYDYVVMSNHFDKICCPKCGTVGHLNPFATYCRHVDIEFLDASNILHTLDVCLKIKRVFCSECETTHSILPAWLLPYGKKTVFSHLELCFESLEKNISGKCIGKSSPDSIIHYEYQRIRKYADEYPEIWVELSKCVEAYRLFSALKPFEQEIELDSREDTCENRRQSVIINIDKEADKLPARKNNECAICLIDFIRHCFDRLHKQFLQITNRIFNCLIVIL